MEGVNVIKTPKPTQLNPEGGILETEAAIHVSNVQLLDLKQMNLHVWDIKQLMVKVRIAKNQAKKLKLIINN